MKRDAKRTGMAHDEAQVPVTEQAPGLASEEAARKKDRDAEWLSMTTGDPALYIKDAE